MSSLTIRNIPESMLARIKSLSEIEKRSINSEILILLENALQREINSKLNSNVSKDTQIIMWERLSGKWKDSRKTKAIISDIYSRRTLGREYDLD